LDAHVNGVIEKREQKIATERMHKAEEARQIEWQTKFESGTKKYEDFWPTVNKTPITSTMMIATRAMENPAAFLYAAAKLQPAELTRIAGIQDYATQMVEMGKLEERMKRSTAVTKAARPLGRIHADSFDEPAEKKREKTIDERVREDEQKKLNRIMANR